MAHLTSFTVENFKRFEHFEMQNIGQFNLIVGDNNVGKTSVLEALLVDENSDIVQARFLKVLTEFRNLQKITEPYWHFFINRATLLTERLPTKFTLGQTEGTTIIATGPIESGYKWFVNGEHTNVLSLENTVKMKYNGVFRYDGTNSVHVPLVPFAQAYSNVLANIYSAYFQRDEGKDAELMKTLAIMIPQIKKIDVDNATSTDAVLYIGQHGQRSTMPLAMMGDGTIRLVRIAFELELHKGKRLMIDEIDAGLHFSHLRNFWRKIILGATLNDIQIFATSHNWECLEVFKEVLEEPEMLAFQDKARCFTLIDSPVTKRVEAVCSTFEQFETAIENGTELRGGAVV